VEVYIENVLELMRLLIGSVIYRPYVYVFFICFLVFAIRQMGAFKTLFYTIMAWALAFLAEWSSTRNGFPFGMYHYIDTTRYRELWVSNVPFWDSLSFVFLSYFSFNLAAALLSKPGDIAQGRLSGIRHPAVPILGGFLMMLLDMVIDPVSLQGDKWFLGRIYFYPAPGPHFGVTFENYAGWWFLGTFTQYFFQKFFFKGNESIKALPNLFIWGVLGVYVGVFMFMVGITIYIGEMAMLMSHLLIIFSVIAPVLVRLIYLSQQGSNNYNQGKAAQAL
jgi:putative membrane protein